jgi:hypothetical protein
MKLARLAQAVFVIKADFVRKTDQEERFLQ